MGKVVGEDFQTETKYTATKSSVANLNWANKPEIYKSYPSSKTIRLPKPVRRGNSALRARQFVAKF